MNDGHVRELPRAHGASLGRAILRESPEAFIVDEQLGFEASGEGEHVLLHVEKRALNTLDVQSAIASLASVPLRDVGYAGLKDKWACTRQWFSVPIPASREPDWRQLERDVEAAGDGSGLQVLAAARHSRKLRRGAHRANRFVLRLRLRERLAATAVDQLGERIQALCEAGFPNYFTEQRFGYRGRNLEQARALFAGRKLSKVQRSMALSAARSLLFNEVLASRVARGSWCEALDGDVLMLAGSQSVFLAETGVDQRAQLQRRLRACDIHVSGPLPGEGGVQATGEAGEIEQAVLARHAELQQGLVDARASAQRRAMRALVGEMQWALCDDVLELQFELERGSYATALLRELLDYDDVAGAAWR